jgi:prepilin-type N-terminal cleavage/methylation domain-containing protein
MRRRQAGFSLIEMIIVIVILGIASVAVVTMVAGLGSRQDDNRDLQVGAQLLQECGEWIVASHRRDENFFTDVLTGTSTNCFSGPAAYGGFNQPTVAVTDTSGGGWCPPSPAECKTAVITITKSGNSLQPISLMVVKYN